MRSTNNIDPLNMNKFIIGKLQKPNNICVGGFWTKEIVLKIFRYLKTKWRAT